MGITKRAADFSTTGAVVGGIGASLLGAAIVGTKYRLAGALGGGALGAVGGGFALPAIEKELLQRGDKVFDHYGDRAINLSSKIQDDSIDKWTTVAKSMQDDLLSTFDKVRQKGMADAKELTGPLAEQASYNAAKGATKGIISGIGDSTVSFLKRLLFIKDKANEEVPLPADDTVDGDTVAHITTVPPRVFRVGSSSRNRGYTHKG